MSYDYVDHSFRARIMLVVLAMFPLLAGAQPATAILGDRTYVCFDFFVSDGERDVMEGDSVAEGASLDLIPLLVVHVVAVLSPDDAELEDNDSCVVFDPAELGTDGDGEFALLLASDPDGDPLFAELPDGFTQTTTFEELADTITWTLDGDFVVGGSDYVDGVTFPEFAGQTFFSSPFSVPSELLTVPGRYLARVDLAASPLRDAFGAAERQLSILFTIGAPSTGSGPAISAAISVTCGSEAPVVGSSVTCTVQSEPDFDFVWRASTNPEFASGVVTTDENGTGEFTFDVPAAALGQEVLVEIVDWTGPEPIGVASGPVPTTVPAGEGHTTVPMVLIAFVVLGMAGLALRSRAVTVTR